MKKNKGICYVTYVDMNYVTAVQIRSCRVSRTNCQSVGTPCSLHIVILPNVMEIDGYHRPVNCADDDRLNRVFGN
jgi:hypothetical protein